MGGLSIRLARWSPRFGRKRDRVRDLLTGSMHRQHGPGILSCQPAAEPRLPYFRRRAHGFHGAINQSLFYAPAAKPPLETPPAKPATDSDGDHDGSTSGSSDTARVVDIKA